MAACFCTGECMRPGGRCPNGGANSLTDLLNLNGNLTHPAANQPYGTWSGTMTLPYQLTMADHAQQLLEQITKAQAKAATDGDDVALDAWREAHDALSQTMIAVARATKAGNHGR